MNSVHRYHSAAAFEPLKHFVITLHDSRFDCVAFEAVSTIVDMRQNDVLSRMTEALRDEDAGQRLI